MALWKKIERRIDAEADKYMEISAKRKEAAQRRHRLSAQGEEPGSQKQETEAEPQKAAPFEKPTAEEVRQYCEERKNGVDWRAFYDFYESKGWKVGQAKMRDWRASVRTWEQRKRSEDTGGRKKSGAAWGSEGEIPEEIESLF